MKYLQKLAGGIDTTLALHTLMRQPELWDGNHIILRGIPARKTGLVNWFAFDLLPQLRPFIFGVMAKIEGEILGTVSLLRLAPGEKWEVSHYEHDYYFLCVSVLPGVSVQSHEEGVMLIPGDVWWVKEDAHFINNSQDDFIILEIEAQPASPATYVPEPKL